MLEVSPRLTREGDGENTSTSLFRGLVRSRSTTCRSTRRCSPGAWRRKRARSDGSPESLKVAKHAAQVPQVQLAQCEQFVARAEKRLATHDEERMLLVQQLEDGKQRLQKLQEEVQSPAPAVASVKQMVNTLQSERDALAAQIQTDKTDVSSHGIVARRRTTGSRPKTAHPRHAHNGPRSFPSGWKTDRRI